MTVEELCNSLLELVSQGKGELPVFFEGLSPRDDGPTTRQVVEMREMDADPYLQQKHVWLYGEEL